MSKSRVRQVSSVCFILALALAFGSVLMTPTPAAGAAIWYVDGTNGTDNATQGTGPGINAFKTIQYAINDARVVDGDTINVAAGTYNEDILISKGLTIQSSAGADNTTIHGSGVGSSYYMIRIYHSDVTFNGFTVTNPDYQGGADASGILVGTYPPNPGVSVNNTRILNNIIKEIRNGTGGTPSGFGATGINIGAGAPSNIVISGNIIEDIHNPPGASIDHTCGINVWDNGSGIVISNNSISNIKYNGILFQYANNVHVTSNNITLCPVGIKIDPYTGAVVLGVTIDHNIIVENSDYGVDNHAPNLINAQNNWWGCNDGPGIVGPGSGDKVSDNVTYDPWLVLNMSANPTSILANGVSTSAISADMNKNSDGQDTSAQGHIPDGTQIIFTTDKGSIGSLTTTKATTNGVATAVFTSDTNPSQATISARAPTCYTCATASVSVNMYSPTPSGGGGWGGGLPASYIACPVTMATYMQGTITTVRMTSNGVLCDTCLAKDATEEYTLEIDKDTTVMLADNTVPLILRFSESSTTPPTPENTVTVGPVYELSAYSSILETTPSPVTISPPAKLTMSYNPDELPPNTTEVFIANYDTEEGWLALAPVPGAVAEIGKAHGLASRFSPFAVLAKVEDPPPAKFEASNLTIKPSQAQPNQEITISLNVANTGGTTEDYMLEMKIDGVVKTTRQITLTPETSSSESFKLTLTAPGEHYLEIGGLSGQIKIVPQDTPYNKWRPFGIAAFIILVLLAVIVLALIIKPLASAQKR